MALGPKLNFINPGDALRSSRIMQNFQAIADFCRAIPVNNLLQPYQTVSYDMEASDAVASAVAPGTTRYFGYMRVQLGQSPTNIATGADAWFRGPVAGLAAGDTVVFDLEKATPTGPGGQPLFADAWTSILPAVITFNNANTVAGIDDILGDQGAFVRTSSPNVLLNDGDWIRWKVTVTDVGVGYSVGECGGQLAIKSYLRS
tara:strand:+ start:467 stop:1072 length:606 start_codon:yes stop_codon:yes gene_type:complete